MDEAHLYGGQESQNAYCLAYLKTINNIHVHLMSATIAESPAKFRALGFLLGLHDFVHFTQWALENKCYFDDMGKLQFNKYIAGEDSPLLKLHQQIFPKFGIRLRVTELEGFPENTINPVLIQSDCTSTYKKMVSEYMSKLTEESIVQDLENGGWAELPTNHNNKSNARTELLRERQRAELLKLPYLVQQIQNCMDETKSAAIFLNFRESTRWLHRMLGDNGIPSVLYTGDIVKSQREVSKQKFQDNEVHCFIGTTAASGTGIDLHDLKGRPRETFISPSFSVVLFQQVLGRIHRAGSLSPAVQHVICLQGTAEEMVLTNLNRKIKNLTLLNDGDIFL